MAEIKLYVTRWSADCEKAKNFLTDEGIFFEEVDIEKLPKAARRIEKLTGKRRLVPAIEINGKLIGLKPFDIRKLQSVIDEFDEDE